MQKLILIFAIIFTASFTFAQGVPPAIFYANLTSGPNTGGQNNAGAFVTIRGKGFGASRGSSVVTIGGGAAASYQYWSDGAVTFQLGASARTGNIVVNAGGVASNSIPFTVRAGRIYFVSTQGNDSNQGSYSSPWRTAARAAILMIAGDIAYLEDGYSQSASTLTLATSGTASSPIAMVAYPNSVATIGSATGPTTGVSVTGSNWVLSNLVLRGAKTAVSTGNIGGLRLAGNNISCPNGSGSGACIATNGGSSFALLGNGIHDNGLDTASSLSQYHAVYLLGTNGVEIGWNVIANTRGCNAIGAHADTGLQYGYKVHDNYIYNTRCQAISLGTIDPSRGAVSVYNNILQNSGTGPATPDTNPYGYAAVTLGGGSSTPAQVYNNTIYDAGSFGGGKSGALRAFGAVKLVNNIVYVTSSEQYVSADTNLSWVTGTNNLFAGAGNPVGVFANSVVADPMFVNVGSNDFHLQSVSPAINKGAIVQLATDYDGSLRPQGGGYDIGAYESVGGSTSATAPAATGTLSATPTSLSFGNVSVGQSGTTTAILTNSGRASVTISQANSNNGAFKVSGLTFPLALAAGQSATMTVTFVPSAAGSQTGTIAVASNASNSSLNIAVSGTGASSISTLTITTTALPSGTVGTPYSATLTAANGTAPYTWSNAGCTGSCNTGMTFSANGVLSGTPVNAGTSTWPFKVVDANGNTTTKQLTITINAPTTSSTLAITTTALPSGTVGTPYSATLTAANGTAPYTWSNAGCTGSCNTGMTFSANGVLSGTPVNAGTSTWPFKVVDANGNTTTKQLTITINAPPPITSTTSHSVSLAWAESSTVAGYNVYRSTQSGSGYSKLNNSLISAQSYSDASVTNGQTYYYVITSVDGSGNESGYSAQVSGVVPTT